MRAKRLAVCTAAITLALSGCTEEKLPTARPQPSPPTTSSTTRPIAAPMNLTGVDACALITKNQAAERGIELVETSSAQHEGRVCYLRDPRERLETTLLLYIGSGSHSNRYGPDYHPPRSTEIFSQREPGDYEGVRLTPTSIAGYPALQGSFGPDEDYEVCHIAIDVADTQGITLRQDGLRIKHRTCDDALELAEIVIENLRGR